MDTEALFSALVGGVAGAIVSSAAAVGIYWRQASAARRHGLLRTLQRVEEFVFECHRCAMAALEAEQACYQGESGGVVPAPSIQIDESLAINFLSDHWAAAVLALSGELRRTDRAAAAAFEHGCSVDAYSVLSLGFARTGLNAFRVAQGIRSRLGIGDKSTNVDDDVLEDLRRLACLPED